MKKLALIAIAVLALSCKKESQEPFGKPEATTEKSPEALGKEIFEGKGNCIACHPVLPSGVSDDCEVIALRGWRTGGKDA